MSKFNLLTPGERFARKEAPIKYFHAPRYNI